MTGVLTAQQLLPFSAAALLFLLSPGPAVLYVVARSAAGGLKDGIATTIGVACGNVAQVLILGVGLGALLADSPANRTAVLLAGSVYLLTIGVRQFLGASQYVSHGTREQAAAATATDGHRKALADAAIVSMLNPKSMLFLFAFVPQFTTETSALSIKAQLLVLGLTYVVIGLATDAAYAYAGSRLGHAVAKRNPALVVRMRRVSAGVIALIGLAGLVSVTASW